MTRIRLLLCLADYIEKAALSTIGTLLEGTGWTSAIAEAGVASSGTAESLLNAASITKTRLAHQVAACSLYILEKEAYTDFCSEERARPVLSSEAWTNQQKHQSLQS